MWQGRRPRCRPDLETPATTSLTLMPSRATTRLRSSSAPPRGMDLEHFGLRERPFSNAPDLRFVYLGAHHEQALAYLRHGIEAQQGIIVFTGERGTGTGTTSQVLQNTLPEPVDRPLTLTHRSTLL